MSNDNKKTEPAAVPAVPVAQTVDEKIASAVSKAVSAAISESMPIAMMAAAKMTADTLRPPNLNPPEKYHRLEHCNDCGQLKLACREEHEFMYVGPRNHRRFNSYPGQLINGIAYKSPSFGKKIAVPKANSLAYDIQTWENAEEDMQSGRTLSHNTGVISATPGQTRINHANPVGFRGLIPG